MHLVPAGFLTPRQMNPREPRGGPRAIPSSFCRFETRRAVPYRSCILDWNRQPSDIQIGAARKTLVSRPIRLPWRSMYALHPLQDVERE